MTRVLLLALVACRGAGEDATPSPRTEPTGDPAPTGGDSTSRPSTAETAPTAVTGASGPTAAPTADTSAYTGAPTASPYITLSGPPPTNVLLLSVDTVRAERLNGNGYTLRTTSPTIDALLAEGLALRNHRSCSSWTMASFLCFLTGMDQVTLGTWPDNNRHGKGLLPYPTDDLPSMAWHLQERGFATRLVTANALIGPNYNMTRGHDDVRRTFVPTETADVAIERLSEVTSAGAPWFVHAHFMAPHTPYDPDPSYLDGTTSCPGHDLTGDGFRAWTRVRDEQSPSDRAACDAHLAALYDGLLAETDHHLGRILAALDASGQRDDTAIVFVTDHGEGFDDHDDWEHGYGNYDELIRATAGVVYPRRIAPAVHHGLTTHEDALPTLFTLLDLPVPPELTGHPVGAVDRDQLVQLTYSNAETHQSVTTADAKLVLDWEHGLEHYDLLADPGEQTNLWNPDAATSQALWKRLEPHVTELAARVTDGSAPAQLP